jgi:hypothetical protein
MRFSGDPVHCLRELRLLRWSVPAGRSQAVGRNRPVAPWSRTWIALHRQAASASRTAIWPRRWHPVLLCRGHPASSLTADGVGTCLKSFSTVQVANRRRASAPAIAKTAGRSVSLKAAPKRICVATAKAGMKGVAEHGHDRSRVETIGATGRGSDSHPAISSSNARCIDKPLPCYQLPRLKPLFARCLCTASQVGLVTDRVTPEPAMELTEKVVR